MAVSAIRRMQFSWLKNSVLGLVIGLFGACQMAIAEQHVYFGTGSKLGDGIYHSLLNEKTGDLSKPTKVADIKAPGFLAQHPSLEILYAVASINKEPVVAAYKIADDGKLTFINHVEINDGGAAHIAVHPSGKFLLTAQYGGNSVALFSIDNQGKLIAREQLIEHKGGSNVYKNRQKKPHPHWVGFSPDGKFAFVPDLGMDVAMIYRVSADTPKITYHGRAVSMPGGGPRHMRFSTNGDYIYLLNEFTLAVSTFAYDKDKGTAKTVSVAATLSEEAKSQEGFNSASEILVHPSGQFVYAANRGHDSISVFSSDENTGKLNLLEIEHVRGSFPRNINMDLKGKWLLAAGQHSNTVSTFAIDQNNGLLQYQTGKTVNVPEPICVLFKD